MRSEGETFELEDILEVTKGRNGRRKRGAIIESEAERNKSIAKSRSSQSSVVNQSLTSEYCRAEKRNKVGSSYRGRHIFVLLQQYRIDALV